MIDRIVSYSIFPVFITVSILFALYLQSIGIPNIVVTPTVVAPFVVVVIVLERLRPLRNFVQRDFSLALEAMHFVFNFEFGYGLALLASRWLEQGVKKTVPVYWPTDWAVGYQLLLAIVLYEASSYWQHRLFHHRRKLWAFHALHHSGAHLDFIRAGRFHFVDFATVAFIAYLPLVILGAPDRVVTLLAVLVSILGLVHHGNVRQLTPIWLDYVVCTPAVHRQHHSMNRQECNANYGNTIMIFDMLFGTYNKPRAPDPVSIGIEDDPLPERFWGQMTMPFRLLTKKYGEPL